MHGMLAALQAQAATISNAMHVGWNTMHVHSHPAWRFAGAGMDACIRCSRPSARSSCHGGLERAEQSSGQGSVSRQCDQAANLGLAGRCCSVGGIHCEGSTNGAEPLLLTRKQPPAAAG